VAKGARIVVNRYARSQLAPAMRWRLIAFRNLNVARCKRLAHSRVQARSHDAQWALETVGIRLTMLSNNLARMTPSLIL